MEHTFPRMGCTLPTHSGHTGSREIFSKGSPQRRQSEGNRTEKRLSATWVVRIRFHQDGGRTGPGGADEDARETIEGPKTAALAWLARIRSSLLLKTASSSSPRLFAEIPRTKICHGNLSTNLASYPAV